MARVYKIHKRSVRMVNNAGIYFPICYMNPANGLLDLDKGNLPLSTEDAGVTCKRCLARLKDGGLW